MSTSTFRSAILALALLFAAACHDSPTAPTLPPEEECGPYPDWQTSIYVLPYAVGSAYGISQGNCSQFGSHRDVARYAYDFEMPIGTEIHAALGGMVIVREDHHPDGTGIGADDNVLRILQDDGTYASYVHLTQNGSLVDIGDTVRQGQAIALSGNSGSTSGLPHLHFQVAPCLDRSVCGTLPVTFRNTDPNPSGLIEGNVYPALPF